MTPHTGMQTFNCLVSQALHIYKHIVTANEVSTYSIVKYMLQLFICDEKLCSRVAIAVSSTRRQQSTIEIHIHTAVITT